MSWTNDRLPELLWGALLLSGLDREPVLEMFRSLGERVNAAGEGAPFDLKHSAIFESSELSRELIVDFVAGPEAAKLALRPLLLLPGLPGYQMWAAAIGMPPDDSDWPRLAKAVAESMYHQSQPATDLRWAAVLMHMAAGKMFFPPAMKERATELTLYPHMGDQRMVRPFIRAAEGAMGGLAEGRGGSAWPEQFWAFCLRNTGCQPLPESLANTMAPVGTTVQRVSTIRREIVDHCAKTATTTNVDARHDTVFGAALYALDIMAELMRFGASTTIGARFSLRVILEVFVTLAYLVAKDDPELWRSYRVFGSGQLKLTTLKLDESPEQPFFIPREFVAELASEDVWQEFLDIDLGHWANANLRSLSVEAGVKGDYDQAYAWTSSFVHGHWGALRVTSFDTCANPLHRLHRIPRAAPREQLDVVVDAVGFCDKVLALLDRAYPRFEHRLA